MRVQIHFITPVGEFVTNWIPENESNLLTRKDPGGRSFISSEGDTVYIPPTVMSQTVVVIVNEED